MSDEIPPPEDDLALSEESQQFARLFRDENATRPYCPVCQRLINGSPGDHARTVHECSLEVLMRAGVLIEPIEDTPPTTAPPTPLEIPLTEAEAHPGGLEGVMVEAKLPPGERPLFRADIEAFVAQNYTPMHLVVSYAYQQVLHRRIQGEIEDIQRGAGGSAVKNARAYQALENIEERILKLTMALEKIKQSRVLKTDDPYELIEAERRRAAEFVQQHVGELEGRCPTCGLILTLPALPHWAFAPNETRDRIEYAVWSPELWALVVAGRIPLHYMSFVLRNSPEGMMLTARRRGETWPDDIVLELEERRHKGLFFAHERKRPLPVPKAE